ncbi:MAG: DUF4012 domain-containing protein [Patescibacteria group bacterium]|jgi:hypothetical protein
MEDHQPLSSSQGDEPLDTFQTIFATNSSRLPAQKPAGSVFVSGSTDYYGPFQPVSRPQIVTPIQEVPPEEITLTAMPEPQPPVLSNDARVTPEEIPGMFSDPLEPEAPSSPTIQHTVRSDETILSLPPVPGRRRTRWIVSVITSAILIFLGVNALGIIWIVSGFYSAAKDAEVALDAVEAMEIDSAVEKITSISTDLTRARNGVYLLQWMRPIPWLGDQIKGVQILLTTAVDTMHVLEDSGALAQDLYHVILDAQIISDTGVLETDLVFEDIPDETKADLLRTLKRALPDLVNMRTKIRIAQKRLGVLANLDVHPTLMEGAKKMGEILTMMQEGIDFLVPLSSTVGELAGVDSDHQWLVLFLNNTELRPGGGFIGVYGILTTRDGSVLNFTTADSYSIDKLVEGDPDWDLVPPKPFSEFMGLDHWYFRDSNWSPDFPTASEQVVSIFRQEFSVAGEPVPQIDGVIGFTPDLAEDLLEILGPVTVDGLTFTHDNVTELLEYQVEFAYAETGTPVEERKEIVSDLTDAVVEKVLSEDLNFWFKALELFEEKINEKHIALYSFDEETEQAFVDYGWAGNIEPHLGDDVLMLVDANIAALKTDPVVDRTIEYSISPDDEGYLGTVTITYDHTGTYTDTTGLYRTFLRIYVPEGSEYLSYDGDIFGIEVEEDLDMLSIGGYVEVVPGDTASAVLTYRLPDSIGEAVEDGLYQLVVYKQMGAKNHALTLDLNFDKNIRTASPEEEEKNWGDTHYQKEVVLDENFLFTVELY